MMNLYVKSSSSVSFAYVFVVMETTLAVLRKESQSIFNRVHSIAEDAAFVTHVHVHYSNLPLLRAFLPLWHRCVRLIRWHRSQHALRRLVHRSKDRKIRLSYTLTLTLCRGRLPLTTPTSNRRMVIPTTGALIYADPISTSSL